MDIYNNMVAQNFSTPTFLCVIQENTEEGFRNIMDGPSLGVLTFDMLLPQFCTKLMREPQRNALVSQTKEKGGGGGRTITLSKFCETHKI